MKPLLVPQDKLLELIPFSHRTAIAVAAVMLKLEAAKTTQERTVLRETLSFAIQQLMHQQNQIEALLGAVDVSRRVH